MEALPEIRARHLQTSLDALDRLAAGRAAAVRAALRDGLVQEIQEASGVSWLPLEHDIEFSLTVKRVLGDAATDRFFRDLMTSGFETPLLSGFVKGALRLAGRNPLFVLRRVPGGMKLVYRNAGSWAVEETGPASARILLADAPSVLASNREYLATVGASLSAVLDLVGRPGSVTLVETSAAEGRAAFDAAWD